MIRGVRYILLIALICFSSCEQEKIVLALRLKQGDTQRTRLTAKQKISQTVEGEKVDVEQTTIIEYIYKIEEIGDKGITKARITYDKLAFIQEGPMGKIEYKSWEPFEEGPLMVQAFASLHGQSLAIELSPRGEVLRIKGADSIIENMMKLFDLPVDENMKRRVRDNLENSFGHVAIKETMEKMFIVFPGRPVNVGESWNATAYFYKGFPMVLKNTWKLRSVENSKVHIGIRSEIEPNTKAKLGQIEGIEMTYELSGSQDGLYVLDGLTGWCITSKINQDFSGIISVVTDQFGKIEKVEWPIEVKGTLMVESISIE